jgi:streptomycin 6-kinase
MHFVISERLTAACRCVPVRAAWLSQLPALLAELQRRWTFADVRPIDNDETSCAWVARVQWRGLPAVLKLAMPHMEGDDEIEGLRFWDGKGMVHVLEADSGEGAMLLEACDPGGHLRALAEPSQDFVIATLLRRLRRVPPPGRFRPLARMLDCWRRETEAQRDRWPDTGLVQEGLQLLELLSRQSADDVLLATDLHAGNVLSTSREPWLAIDPKPFVGDPAYDATQHLLNCHDRLRADGHGLVNRIADLADLDPDRVRLWTFARLAAEPRDDWRDGRMETAGSQFGRRRPMGDR